MDNPQAFQPTIGQEVFLSDGRRAVFSGEIGGQLFVRLILTSEDEYGREEWESDKLTPVSAVHKCEPYEVFGPQTAAAMERLREIQDQTALARANLIDLQKQENAAAAAVSRYPELATAIDFLEGRITHVVVETAYDIKVTNLGDMLDCKDGRGRAEGLKLVSLFGVDRDRKVRWKVNRYYDGSGDWTQIRPFRSQQDAEDYIREAQMAALEQWRAGDSKSGVFKFLKCSIPLDWPEDFAADLDAKKRKNAEERIAYFRQQMEPYEAELAAMLPARKEARHDAD